MEKARQQANCLSKGDECTKGSGVLFGHANARQRLVGVELLCISLRGEYAKVRGGGTRLVLEKVRMANCRIHAWRLLGIGNLRVESLDEVVDGVGFAAPVLELAVEGG